MVFNFFSAKKPNVVGKPDDNPMANSKADFLPREKSTTPGVSFQLTPSPGVQVNPGNELLSRVVQIFNPSQPVIDSKYFGGRSKPLEQLVTAVEEHRNHIFLFGPRGCGKTSLARIFLSVAAQANYRTLYLSCSGGSSLESIFRTVLSSIPRRYDRFFDPTRDEVNPNGSLLDLLTETRVTPQAVSEILSRVTEARVLIVLDEFDRCEDKHLAQDILELMKILSDLAAPIHLMVIGAADELDELILKSVLIPRTVFSLKLGLMSDDELARILSVLCGAAGIMVTRSALQRIIRIAHGKPFTARLVTLRAAKAAILKGSTVIDDENLDTGLKELAEHLESAGFSKLTALVSENPTLLSLLSAALRTNRDAGDYFSTQQVVSQFYGAEFATTTTSIERALTALTADNMTVFEGVEKGGTKKFRFTDPRIELCASILCADLRHSGVQDMTNTKFEGNSEQPAPRASARQPQSESI